MKENFISFLEKNVDIVIDNGFYYNGILKDVTDHGIWIDDRKEGSIFFSFEKIAEFKEGKHDV